MLLIGRNKYTAPTLSAALRRKRCFIDKKLRSGSVGFQTLSYLSGAAYFPHSALAYLGEKLIHVFQMRFPDIYIYIFCNNMEKGELNKEKHII